MYTRSSLEWDFNKSGIRVLESSTLLTELFSYISV